jgi:hypothetical protein
MYHIFLYPSTSLFGYPIFRPQLNWLGSCDQHTTADHIFCHRRVHTAYTWKRWPMLTPSTVKCFFFKITVKCFFFSTPGSRHSLYNTLSVLCSIIFRCYLSLYHKFSLLQHKDIHSKQHIPGPSDLINSGLKTDVALRLATTNQRSS